MVKKKSAKPAKKAVKKTVKKTASKKPVKKAAKKAAPKKAAKKTVKKAAKKAVKKATKKAAPKKVVKKVAPKAKPVKKLASKPVAKKKAIKKKAAAPKPVAPKFVAHSTRLNVGDAAPHFSGIDQNGNTVSLSDFAGKNVILYFYPKDDTPGCTATACSLRDEYQYLSNANYAVVGVSADDEASHKKFAEKFSLPFPLLADTNHEILKAYDVWGQKMFMGRIFDGIIRTTFVIDANGIISQVIKSVDTEHHAQQVLKGN